MKAMIMAAGYGTRLGNETADIPKILVDIGGTTALEWILKKLKTAGVDDVIMNVHYMADQVEEAGSSMAGKLGIGITFSDERDHLMDTGGGLYNARSFFDEKPFILYNGDIITDLDLVRLYSQNINSGSIVTLATRDRPGERVFLFDNRGYLGGWKNRSTNEKIITSQPGTELTELAFSAVAILKPDIFSFLHKGVYSLRPVYLDLSRKRLVDSLRHDNGFWIDIGRPEGLETCRRLMSGKQDG